MKVSYYPGCSLEHSAKDYEESIEGVAGLLDVSWRKSRTGTVVVPQRRTVLMNIWLWPCRPAIWYRLKPRARMWSSPVLCASIV